MQEMERKWRVFLKELKKVSYVAAPMVAITVMQYLIQVVSVMMVGHVDQLSLSGVSIATSLTSVTGFSVLVKSSLPFSSLTAIHATCSYFKQLASIMIFGFLPNTSYRFDLELHWQIMLYSKLGNSSILIKSYISFGGLVYLVAKLPI